MPQVSCVCGADRLPGLSRKARLIRLEPVVRQSILAACPELVRTRGLVNKYGGLGPQETTGEVRCGLEPLSLSGEKVKGQQGFGFRSDWGRRHQSTKACLIASRAPPTFPFGCLSQKARRSSIFPHGECEKVTEVAQFRGSQSDPNEFVGECR